MVKDTFTAAVCIYHGSHDQSIAIYTVTIYRAAIPCNVMLLYLHKYVGIQYPHNYNNCSHVIVSAHRTMHVIQASIPGQHFYQVIYMAISYFYLYNFGVHSCLKFSFSLKKLTAGPRHQYKVYQGGTKQVYTKHACDTHDRELHLICIHLQLLFIIFFVLYSSLPT